MTGRENEFVENEAPSLGVPSLFEMPVHHGEAFLPYLERALWNILERGEWFARNSLWLPGFSTTPPPGPPEEFLEDMPPAQGMPDLCGDYELDPLPVPESPTTTDTQC